MNRTGKDITEIYVHCSAGFGDVAAMRRFWRSMGWRSDGYNTGVDLDGTKIELVPFNLPSNGVKGKNAKAIHIFYRGGVDRNNVNRAVDTRTPQQRLGLQECIQDALQWIHDNGGDVTKVSIKGHRDASPDRNGNGVIDAWERIKECPSFDAIPEYKNEVARFLQRIKVNALTSNPPKRDVQYVVRQGDSLWGIAQKNNITVAQLRSLNNLRTDTLQIGQRLIIAS